MGDRELMRTLTIEHLEGEGDFLLCSADDSHVGDD